MNIYIETNFVLELALLQEQHESCEQILELCESGQAQLVIPAYALAEPLETLIRRERERKKLKEELDKEFTQFRRSIQYSTLIETFTSVLRFLTLAGEQQRQNLAETTDRLLRIADIIPLEHDVLSLAATYEEQFSRSPQDAFVFASVLRYLSAGTTPACFLTRNSKDFNNVLLVGALAQHNCKIMFSFSDGYRYIQSQL